MLTQFILVTNLRDALAVAAPSRVVFTSSDAHRFAKGPLDDVESQSGYRGFDVYAKTKLLQLLLARRFASELSASGIRVYAVNPGAAWTGQMSTRLARVKHDVPSLLSET